MSPYGLPTYGDEFLPEPISDLYDKDRVHPGIDYIMGTASDEGGTMMMVAMDPEASEEENMKVAKEGIEKDSMTEIIFKSIVTQAILNLGPETTKTAPRWPLHHVLTLKLPAAGRGHARVHGKKPCALRSGRLGMAEAGTGQPRRDRQARGKWAPHMPDVFFLITDGRLTTG